MLGNNIICSIILTNELICLLCEFALPLAIWAIKLKAEKLLFYKIICPDIGNISYHCFLYKDILLNNIDDIFISLLSFNKECVLS